MLSSKPTSGHKELSFLLPFCGSTNDLKSKLGYFASETHPMQKAVHMFAEGVANRTSGDITVKVYPAGTLYSQREALQKSVKGIVSMSLATQAVLDEYVKAFAVVMLPFLFDGYEHAHRTLDGPFMDWVAPMLAKKNLTVLSNWEWGFRSITNNVRPIKTPEDAKGLKLRVPFEMQLRAAIEACGALVTEMAFPELYMALKQGILDGQENPLSIIYHFRIYEVQEYLSLTRHVYNCMIHVMSLKVWERLCPEQQIIITEESKKARDFLRRTIQEEESSLLKKLKEEGGVTITYPNVDAFRGVMEPAYTKIAEYAGEEKVKRFREMVETTKK